MVAFRGLPRKMQKDYTTLDVSDDQHDALGVNVEDGSGDVVAMVGSVHAIDPSQTPRDQVAVFLCILIFFGVTFAFASFETIAVPMTKEQYRACRSDAAYV